jgi:hypothetical protein
MPERSKLCLGPTLVVGVLTTLACVAIGFIYIGCDPGATATIIGYVAMGLGLLATILLGVGVALLYRLQFLGHRVEPYAALATG